MSWKEVRKHLRLGARLIYTDEIPGGWCFALLHNTPPAPGVPKLIKVEEIPRWVGVPNPSDTRPVRAALEMAIATEEFRHN